MIAESRPPQANRPRGLLLLGLLAPLAVRADVYVPPPHVMSRVAWAAEMTPCKYGLAVACLAAALFLLVLASCWRRKNFSFMAYLAYGAPLLLLPTAWLDGRFLLMARGSVAGLFALSGVCALVAFLWKRAYAKAAVLLLLAPVLWAACSYGVGALSFVRHGVRPESPEDSRPVEAVPGETYDAYVKRANAVIHHHCPHCDKPMDSIYFRGRHWYCDACGYNTEIKKRAAAEE